MGQFKLPEGPTPKGAYTSKSRGSVATCQYDVKKLYATMSVYLPTEKKFTR